MKIRRATSFLAAVPLLAGIAVAQQKGIIRGVVLDESGEPVAEAKVFADPVGGWRIKWVRQYVVTDADGRFTIDGLDPGKYGVFAMKEESLHPDLSSSFYSDNIFPTAAVTSAAPVVEVRIQLGPKAGVLTGSVNDAKTGKPVLAGIELKRTSSPNEWLSTSIPVNYRVLVPSSTEVSVTFDAPGYKDWAIPGPVKLQPGQEMHVDVSLEPAHDPTLQPAKFLIPDGYVGWLLLIYNQKDAPPAPANEGTKLFKFAQDGTLITSSAGPERAADKNYFYYSADGSMREVPMDYKDGAGMIWGEYEGTRDGAISEFGFFVGTQEQYLKAKDHRPIQ